MTKIVSKKLPNAVSAADVHDANVRQKLTLIIENINSVKTQVSELQNAVVELQRR